MRIRPTNVGYRSGSSRKKYFLLPTGSQPGRYAGPYHTRWPPAPQRYGAGQLGRMGARGPTGHRRLGPVDGPPAAAGPAGRPVDGARGRERCRQVVDEPSGREQGTGTSRRYTRTPPGERRGSAALCKFPFPGGMLRVYLSATQTCLTKAGEEIGHPRPR